MKSFKELIHRGVQSERTPKFFGRYGYLEIGGRKIPLNEGNIHAGDARKNVYPDPQDVRGQITSDLHGRIESTFFPVSLVIKPASGEEQAVSSSPRVIEDGATTDDMRNFYSEHLFAAESRADNMQERTDDLTNELKRLDQDSSEAAKNILEQRVSRQKMLNASVDVAKASLDRFYREYPEDNVLRIGSVHKDVVVTVTDPEVLIDVLEGRKEIKGNLPQNPSRVIHVFSTHGKISIDYQTAKAS